MMRAEFRRKYGKYIADGWVVAEYRVIANNVIGIHFIQPDGRWYIPAIFAAATVDAVGVFIIIAVIALSSLTYHHISRAFGLSVTTRAAQMLLLRTVCVQVEVIHFPKSGIAHFRPSFHLCAWRSPTSAIRPFPSSVTLFPW